MEMKTVTFQLGPLGFKFDGNCVVNVTSNSQASYAGVREGWIITTINGAEQSDETDAIEDTLAQACENAIDELVIVFQQSKPKEKMKTVTFQLGPPLGITFDGNCIINVTPNSQGSFAGIRPGWIITEINGVEAANNTDHIEDSLAKCADDTQDIVILFQQGKLKKMKTVTFQPAALGIKFDGNCIVNVLRNSQASSAGIRPGWIITEINGVEQHDHTELIEETLIQCADAEKDIVILFQQSKSKLGMKRLQFQDGALGFKYEGNCVVNVTPDSQGANAGVSLGWIIVEINGVEQSNDTRAIDDFLLQAFDNKEVPVILFQPSKQKKTVTFQPLGISFDGNRIDNVIRNSQGSNAGIITGWTILEINGVQQADDTEAIKKSLSECFEKGIPIEISFEMATTASPKGKESIKKLEITAKGKASIKENEVNVTSDTEQL